VEAEVPLSYPTYLQQELLQAVQVALVTSSQVELVARLPQIILAAQAEAVAVSSLLVPTLQATLAVLVEVEVAEAEALTTLEHLVLAVTALSIFTTRSNYGY
jgi:hypothetical protein